MFDCLIGLGSNVGDREHYLQRALAEVSAHPFVQRMRHSSWHSTLPKGGPSGQGKFLNGAARFETTLSPKDLHKLLCEIEQSLGRQRGQRWGPRVLDIDLLLCGSQIVSGEGEQALTVPHPRMAFRRFVLEPAMEVAADMMHPEVGWTIAQLHEHVLSWPPYLVISSPDAARAAEIARQTAELIGCKLIRQTELSPTEPQSEAATENWIQNTSSYLENCNALLPTAASWKPDEPYIADFHPASVLADAPPAVPAKGLQPLKEIPMRAKLLVIDEVAQPARELLGHSGPVLAIAKMSTAEAVTEIAAAVAAMRE